MEGTGYEKQDLEELFQKHDTNNDGLMDQVLRNAGLQFSAHHRAG